METFNVMYTTIGRVKTQQVLLQYLTDKKLREHATQATFLLLQHPCYNHG